MSHEHDVVIISAGRADKVRRGYEFTVFRGNEYVAKVVIDLVAETYCVGHSRKEMERLPVEVGDSVKTRF